jgi:hypothetical protein
LGLNPAPRALFPAAAAVECPGMVVPMMAAVAAMGWYKSGGKARKKG